MSKKYGELARKMAGEVWSTPETSTIFVEPKLFDAIAEKLQEVLDKPWLGNASTRELIEELSARISMVTCGRVECDCCGMDYRPAGRICAEAPHEPE